MFGNYAKALFHRFACVAVAIASVLGVPQLVGAAERGFLGAEVRDMTAEEAKARGFEAPKGAVFVRPYAGGAAEKADLKADDVLLEIDGQPVADTNGFISTVQGKAPGTAIAITVLRGTERKIVTAALGTRPVPPPPQEPILRIEAGMHTAPIKRIAVSADAKTLVTGSDDKTVRVWSLPDGRLKRVLRLPIGPGDGGKVFAVAVSPDGRLVAAGGADAAWTAEQQHYVYILNAGSGALVRRLGPLPVTINDLVFSADGARLAAGLGGANGIRAWDAGSGRLLVEDGDYSDAVYGLSFDRSGRLAVTSWDGSIRLYGPDLRLLKKVGAAGGKRPSGIAFSPDGERLAVGYSDTTSVDVLSAGDLRREVSADTPKVDYGNLLSVAWSADGQMLFAGGKYPSRLPNGEWHFPIFRWGEGGRGLPEELAGSLNTIFELTSWDNRGVAYGAGDPAFGLLDGDRRPILRRGAVAPDMSHKLGPHFLVSAHARQVRFGLKQGGVDPWLFDLSAQRFGAAPQPPPTLRPADATGLPINDWRNRTTPTIAGRSLALEQHEISRSLAVLPDQQGFILGTEWRLCRFDAAGELIWGQAPPSVAFGVNTSADGRIVVAAYADGTIRWYRASDGQELLALFIYVPEDPKAEKRWVLWTPKGYYTASPGGEDLIGWHVNRSWDEAPDFFPASRFRDRFYRPDIVQLVLDTLDEEKAVTEANSRAGLKRAEEDVRKEAPPVVSILSPSDGATFRETSVTLNYAARLPSGDLVTDVDVLIDGEKSGTRALGRIDANQGASLTLRLPPRDVTVTVIASAGKRTSEPASIRLRWDGVATAAEKKLPRLWAVLVGVGGYTSQAINKLPYPAKDAEDMDNALKAQKGKAYSQVETQLLKDASLRSILSGLQWLEKSAEEGDVALIFLAGHGVTDASQRFFFLPADADAAELLATGLSNDALMGTIRRLKGRVAVFLDACHSADGFNTPSGKLASADMTRISNEIASPENGAMLYAASTARQLAEEGGPGSQNGAFTGALIEGLSGKADYNGNGQIETDELGVWLRTRVKELTAGAQEPIKLQSKPVPEFTLALVK